MVRSTWLPMLPVHVANWMADPRIQMLEKADRCDLFEALCRSWMLGVAVKVPETIGDVFAAIWPEYQRVRVEHEEKHRRLSERGKVGNRARWGSPGESPKDRPRIIERSPSDPAGDPCGIAPDPDPDPDPPDQVTLSLQDSTVAPASPARAVMTVGERRRARKAPADFRPNDADGALAQSLRLTSEQAGDALASFLDHDFDKPKLDWHGTFRNWLRRDARQFGRRPQPGRGQPLSRDERTRAAFAEVEAQDRLAEGDR